MIGNSRASLAAVRDQVNSRFEDDDLAEAGRQLLAVADLLGREKPLRNSLGDSGRAATDRAALIRQLLENRTTWTATDLASFIASQRWSIESDLVDAYEYAGAEALFGAAERSGDLDRVENELFRFGRILAADGELQLTLSSPGLPASAKAGILSDLLSVQASPTTLELLTFVTTHLRGRRMDRAIEDLTELAAERRGKLVAVVRVAQPLDDIQTSRLAAALERIYAQPVALNFEIDPTVLGGVSVQIGDEVIDGSIAGRLETARRRVTG